MTLSGMTRTAVGIGLVALVAFTVPGTTFAQDQDPSWIPGGSLDPSAVTKYSAPMIIPPAMPRTDVIGGKKGEKKTDYYEIAVRQFQQQILPSDLPMTTVWSYGSLTAPGKSRCALNATDCRTASTRTSRNGTLAT